MKSLLLIFAISALAIHANGQSTANSKDQMKVLGAWPGHWTGTSVWTMRGKAENALVDETIAWRVDGHALLINGLGTSPEGKVVHEALGVLSYDAVESRYRLRTWLRDGRSADAWFNVVADNQYQWGFNAPQGKIRYTISVTDKTWKETGEFSSDSVQWHPFFEMNLTRQSD